MYEEEYYAADGSELKLIAKNTLTSIPKGAIDYKISFGFLDQVFHCRITDSLVCNLDQVIQFILDFSFLVCEIKGLGQMTWVSFSVS